MERLGEGFGQAIGQGGGDDRRIVVAGRLVVGGDGALAMAGGDGEAADPVGPGGGDEIGQGGVGLAFGLGHLLAKGVQARALGGAGLVGPDDDIVAIGVGRNQRPTTPRASNQRSSRICFSIAWASA